MKSNSLCLNADGRFFQKFLDDLGFVRYSDEMQSAFLYAIECAYGEESLDEPGIAYLDINAFESGEFARSLPSQLRTDNDAVSAWTALVRRATVTLRHQGGYSNRIESDWAFEIDIATAESSCISTIQMTVENKKVKKASLYCGADVNLDHQWTAFLLRYL